MSPDPAGPLEEYLEAIDHRLGYRPDDVIPVQGFGPGIPPVSLGDLRRAVAAIRTAGTDRLHAEAALVAAREANVALVAEVDRLAAELARLIAELVHERARFDEAERSWSMIGKVYYITDRGRERCRWGPFGGKPGDDAETFRELIDRRIAAREGRTP